MDINARLFNSQRRNIKGTENPHNAKTKFPKLLQNRRLFSNGGTFLQNWRDSTPIKRITYKFKSNKIVMKSKIDCVINEFEVSLGR